ncbi:protein slx4 [Aspergillus mulundensis]|uniref:Structure-specific endonuclease subunit SLX4 n=1 Tax=Aspergillus mulundensis TaxID=1810919 RepID=A0A3D8Q7C3_9EURO|nr:hypothetical protein DSM5745_11465 [Aspergillus mulundensis]RDW57570.1 hypothetical protein DSM5745_11465 [Aspergillus mulundensis]
MRTATDLIVLSSSPESSAICIPPLSLADAKTTSLRDPSISPSPSLSKSSRPPTRSRFFSTPPYSQTKTADRITQGPLKKKETAADANPITLEDKPKSRGRKPKFAPQTEVQGLIHGDAENKENAPTKPKRTRKKKEESRAGGDKLKNKTITGKVTKSGRLKTKTSGAKPVDGEKTTRERSAGKEDTHSSCEKDEGHDLQLEIAMKRRMDWTPTKKPANSPIDLGGQDDTANGPKGLGILLSEYEFSGTGTTMVRDQAFGDSEPTKRRQIELVDHRVLPVKPKPLHEDNVAHDSEMDASLSAVSKPSKKPKPKTKRLTTLTARVTASYSEISRSRSDPNDQAVLITAENTTGAKSKSRKKKTADENPAFNIPRTVCPPEEASKSLDQQVLVFGTCSQLEREDSPTLLKDTQVALQESEKESARHPCLSSGIARQSSAVLRFATRRNLWSVAARDAEGQVADVEVVNLVDSPETTKSITLPLDGDKEKYKALSSPDASIQIASSLDDEERNDGNGSAATGTSSLSDMLAAKCSTSIDGTLNYELAATKSYTVEQPACKKPKATHQQSMPSYQGKTDLQLASEVQSYGFKPLKNRQKNIELLEKCWLAKQGPATHVASEETATNPSASEANMTEEEAKQSESATQKRTTKARPQPQSTKDNCDTTTNAAAMDENKQPSLSPRPKSRPQHQPPLKRSYMEVEEIEDSEDESLPSPTALLSQFIRSPPQKEEKANKNKKQKQKHQELHTSTIPSSLSPSASAPLSSRLQSRQFKAAQTKAALPANSVLPDLGEQITKAVRAQPRQSLSQSPDGRKRFSWHEKILMYDPICLEDFTAWLNTEGLALVNEDREVTPGFVRQWCESKGICCCFRVRKTAGHF